MNTESATPQPLDTLMNELGLTSKNLVSASREQLTFKNVQQGRSGRRISINIQDKILNALLSVKPDLKLRRRELFHYDMPEESVEGIHKARALVAKGKVKFPQYVDLLQKAGVNRYSVDVASHLITFYGAGGDALIEQGPVITEETQGHYDVAAISAAIKAAQKSEIDYPTFLKQIHQAGITSYEVNIMNREIRYRGEAATYKENIPAAGALDVTPKPVPKPVAKKKKKPVKVVANSLKRRKAAKAKWRKRR